MCSSMRTEETIKDTLLRGRQVHQLLDPALYSERKPTDTFASGAVILDFRYAHRSNRLAKVRRSN